MKMKLLTSVSPESNLWVNTEDYNLSSVSAILLSPASDTLDHLWAVLGRFTARCWPDKFLCREERQRGKLLGDIVLMIEAVLHDTGTKVLCSAVSLPHWTTRNGRAPRTAPEQARITQYDLITWVPHWRPVLNTARH